MKKFAILLVTLTIASCASRVEEQNFVNPIFYKIMEPISNIAWNTQITPTEMISSNKGDIIKQNCTLTENTTNAVTLRCEGPNPDRRDYIILYQFVLIPENKDYGGMLVHMFYWSPNELAGFKSHMSFVIN